MQRHLLSLPFFGIILFIILYFYSASLYPGGTKFDPTTQGYSHLDNYWSDLVDPRADNGQTNPGRPYAIVATVLLPLSLITFWFFVPNLFAVSRWQTYVVRVAGCLSMLLAAGMFLEHDSTINLASIFGFVAFATTLLGLLQKKHFKLLLAGTISIMFSFTNYLMWRTDYGLEFMPMVQKMAYVSIFVWVTMTCRQIKKVINSTRQKRLPSITAP